MDSVCYSLSERRCQTHITVRFPARRGRQQHVLGPRVSARYVEARTGPKPSATLRACPAVARDARQNQTAHARCGATHIVPRCLRPRTVGPERKVAQAYSTNTDTL